MSYALNRFYDLYPWVEAESRSRAKQIGKFPDG